MGYKEAATDQGIRFVVKFQTICEERKTPALKFEEKATFNPSTKETVMRFIKPYSEVEAFIERLEFRDTEQKYDQRYISWELHLIDEHGEPATLSLNLNSKVASRFMKTAENLDFNKMVIFRAWADKQTDPPSTAFFIGQGRLKDGKAIAIPQKYTREHMEGCPEPVETRKGWSYDAQEDWLINRMLEVVVPAVDKAAAKRGSAAPQQPQEHSQPDTRPEPETEAEPPARAQAPRNLPDPEPLTDGARTPMPGAKRNMLLALARGCEQSNGTLDATIKGFFPGESIDSIIAEEADIIMGYFRDMMQAKNK